MRGLPLLAWRQVSFHPVRSAALVLGVALTLFLPVSVERLVERYGTSLRARAAATPLVLGAPGSRYDLVLQALYFRGRTEAHVTLADAEELAATGLAAAIPVVGGLTAGGQPLVGVDHEYYAFRGLTPARGALPLHLGECVVGARAAGELAVDVGDALFSDRESLYDLSRGYPLKMRVAGVLAPTGGPDDGAVFAAVRTAWIAAGLGHGHEAEVEGDDPTVLRRDPDGGVVFSAAVVEYAEVTPENAGDFHFHGGPASLPLVAVLVVPRDAKARTILKGRYRVRDDLQLSEPAGVMEDLLELVFRVKVFFDANTALVLSAASLFLAVIVTLTLAVRAGERRTLVRLGCPRGTVARLFALELGFVLAVGLALAVVFSTVFVNLVSRHLWTS